MDTRFSKARKQHKKDIMERKEIVSEIKKEFNKTDKILELGIKSDEILETIEGDFKEKTKLSKYRYNNFIYRSWIASCETTIAEKLFHKRI